MKLTYNAPKLYVPIIRISQLCFEQMLKVINSSSLTDKHARRKETDYLLTCVASNAAQTLAPVVPASFRWPLAGIMISCGPEQNFREMYKC